MPKSDRHEQKFLNALSDIFVGAKIEGESGYINLMRIKSRYYTEGVFPQLMRDIDAACRPFDPAFREELFDKLHDFFGRYFSESGSIYFRHTAFHHNVYERVYTDDRDVMLFWKTHMLYYVKTDRLFNTMDVEMDGQVFRFDVGGLEHKRANEKRELIYDLKGWREGKVVLAVAYSERGRKTKSDDILRELRKKGVAVDDETLARACRVFEKQSEVDYFINKNARAFLREQFDLWLYQYVFSGDTDWREARLRQLGALKEIAGKIIDFIAQFEDELVRVWNKPKFVLNSHYVITLDKITDGALRGRLLDHAGMAAQAAEWRELGMVDEAFTPAQLNIMGGGETLVSPQYQFLPLDTRYFADLELDILALFDDLDEALDGWLIHSENYQGLNTLGEKFRERVQAIYIDPPYNTSASEIIYVNNYKDASWLTLIENRLRASKSLLSIDGVLCATIDDFELTRLKGLIEILYGEDAILGTVAIRNNPAGRSTAKGFSIAHEYALFVRKSDDTPIGRLERTSEQVARYSEKDEQGNYEWVNFRKHGGANALRQARPKLFYPIFVREGGLRIPKMVWDESLREWNCIDDPNPDETILFPISPDGEERTWKWGHETGQRKFSDLTVRYDQQKKLSVYMKSRMKEEGTLPLTWWDKSIYSASEHGTNLLKKLFGMGQLFAFPKSVYATGDCIKVANSGTEIIVLDFFAGSGTTAHAVINLNRADGGRRKYILMEMGEHFNTVILPRVKKVVYSDKWKDGKAQPGQGISHFAKYYDLEQYEDTLRRAHYDDYAGDQKPLLTGSDPYGPYAFLRDLRLMKDTVRLDETADAVSVRLDALYPGIDLAETLSNVTGKGIRRITRERVEFQDGSSASLTEPDWHLLKPLLWW